MLLSSLSFNEEVTACPFLPFSYARRRNSARLLSPGMSAGTNCIVLTAYLHICATLACQTLTSRFHSRGVDFLFRLYYKAIERGAALIKSISSSVAVLRLRQ